MKIKQQEYKNKFTKNSVIITEDEIIGYYIKFTKDLLEKYAKFNDGIYYSKNHFNFMMDSMIRKESLTEDFLINLNNIRIKIYEISNLYIFYKIIKGKYMNLEQPLWPYSSKYRNIYSENMIDFYVEINSTNSFQELEEKYNNQFLTSSYCSVL